MATLDEAIVRAFAQSARRYLQDVATELGVHIVRIGIDAPSAPCREGLQRRAPEQALDQAGISCFTTPSRAGLDEIRTRVVAHLEAGGEVSRLPHANQLWMIVGFALFEELSQVAECIEVFPQATARALGAAGVHKFKSGGVEAQLRAVARHTGWPSEWKGDPRLDSIAWGPKHDCLDAYLSAWVAALDESERVALGEPPDAVIWVPRTTKDSDLRAAKRSEPARQAEAGARAQRETAEGRSETIPGPGPSPMHGPSGHARHCPACGEKLFKRWPWGWDSHAAHACTGLEASDPEERKREFRRRFADHF